ncbi:MAG: hypothetical protein JST54_35100 [Deltaproteobacteria bacterium]|nr:hypothetical protein [Deltaproteobacteria bacterium]
MATRINGVIVGLWIFISAFLWRHTPEEFALTWVCGTLAALLAAAAIFQPLVRHLNTVVALVLFVGTMVFRIESEATFWSNLVSAVALAFISQMPSEEVAGPPSQPLHHT